MASPAKTVEAVESGAPLMGAEGKAAYAVDDGAVKVEGQKDKFIGLTKEELEAYRTAPGWRNLRYLLFGLFWLAWIAMFAAAIAIVVTSPPCPAKEIPHWWQTKLAYQIFTPSFKDSDGDGLGDIGGVASQMGALRRLDAQTIWPRPLLKSKAGSYALEDVTDHSTIDPRYGSDADLDALIADAASNSLFFVMDFPLATSTEHIWFDKSLNSQDGFDQVYEWSKGNKGPGEWTRDATRKEYYRHLKGKPGSPVLNLASDQGFAKVEAALTDWIKRGVDGFYFTHLDFVARSSGKPNWDKAAQLLGELDTAILAFKNSTGHHTEQFALFGGVAAGVSEADIAKLTGEGGLTYVYEPSLSALSWEGKGGPGLTDCKSSAKCISTVLEKVEKEGGKDHLFELGNMDTARLADRFGAERAVLMEMLLLTLPGAVSHYYGDELPMKGSEAATDGFQPQHGLMQWSAEANAGFSSAASGELKAPQPNADYLTNNFAAAGSGQTLRKLFSRLGGLRKREETLMIGSFEVFKLSAGAQDKALITVRRPKEGRSGNVYVTVLNFANRTMASTDLTPGGLANSGATVVASTPMAVAYQPRMPADLSTVSLPALSGVVFRYAHEEPKVEPVPDDDDA